MTIKIAGRSILNNYLSRRDMQVAFEAHGRVLKAEEDDPTDYGLSRFTDRQFYDIAFRGTVITEDVNVDLQEMSLLREVTYSYTATKEADIENSNKFIGQVAIRSLVGDVYHISKFHDAIQAVYTERGHNAMSPEVAGYIFLVMLDALDDADDPEKYNV